MRHQIVITESAEGDIRQAMTWWSENRSREEAKLWYQTIRPAIATLAKHPDRCPLAPETDLLSTGLRQLHFGVSRKTTHRIVFTIDNDVVRILRVRHVAQRDLEFNDLH